MTGFDWASAGIFGVIFIYSVLLHEIGHGAAALAFGDQTAREAGRLSLNPLRHADPIGTFLVPAALWFGGAPFLLGWARPVPYDPRRFRSLRIGLWVVAASGPLVNLLLAVLLASGIRFVGDDGPGASILASGAAVNLILAAFNLLPIPPLDGSRMLAACLGRRAIALLSGADRWGMVLLLGLAVTGRLGDLFGVAARLLQKFL